MKYKEEVFYSENGKTLEQIVQRGGGWTIFRMAWLDRRLSNLF